MYRFPGAGGLIHVGYSQFRAWGVASVNVAGNTHACGAGLLHTHGGATHSSVISVNLAGK